MNQIEPFAKDLIILFNGNVMILTIPEKDVTNLDSTLEDACRNQKWVSLSAELPHRVNGAKIDGWYFRDNALSPQEKLLNIVQEMTDDSRDGEGWKDRG